VSTEAMMMTKLLKAFGLLVITAAVAGLAPAQAQTTVRYLHTDALGTVVAKTDANGNVVERTTFEPYGAVVGGAVADGPGYTGHVSDAATGLSYMQQRYYDPEVGLFLSVDPVTAYSEPIGQFNRYRYANGNPYRFTDPDGRQVVGAPRDFYNPVTAEQARQILPIVADFTPVLGDVKGIVEAIQAPTPANIAGAAVGVVPIGGDIAKAAIKNGGRVGDFTRAQKNAAKAENAAQNGGKMACTDCTKGVESVASQRGVPTPSNQAQIHHDPAIKDGGGKHSKAVVLCPGCHNDRHKGAK